MNDIYPMSMQLYKDMTSNEPYPTDVNGLDNRTYRHYCRILTNYLYSCLKWKLPREIPSEWVNFWVLKYGLLGWFNTPEYGWVPLMATVPEMNMFYRPFSMIPSSRFINSTRKYYNNINCVAMYAMPDMCGLDDIIRKYAVQFSMIDSSINVNLINAKVAYWISANDSKEVEEFKQMLSDITYGRPSVFYSKKTQNKPELFFGNVKNTYIVDQLIESKRQLKEDFLTEIGIRNTNRQKKERLITSEINENNDETHALIDQIVERLQQQVNVLNYLSGLGVSVEYRWKDDPEKGVDSLEA